MPDPTAPGQESVWSYPRPAIAELCERRITIVHRGVTLADTRRAVRTLETSHPPSYYFSPDDVDQTALALSSESSFCEWKGAANYFDATLAGETFRNVAWSYARPSPAFVALRDHFAFYAAPFDQCLIDGERVTPQPAASMAVGSVPTSQDRSRACLAAAFGDAGSQDQKSRELEALDAAPIGASRRRALPQAGLTKLGDADAIESRALFDGFFATDHGLRNRL